MQARVLTITAPNQPLDFAANYFVAITVRGISPTPRELEAWVRILHKHGVLEIELVPGLRPAALKAQLRAAGLSRFRLAASGSTKLLQASRPKQPHTHDALLGPKAFAHKCQTFRQRYPRTPPTSWIITVYNEARNLPQFLSFLENSQNQTGAAREYIFVVNGCTDNSEQIIKDYLKQSYLPGKLVKSEKGLLPAFKKGIKSRTLNGFVGRFDADIILHPHTLDLLQMHLVEQPQAKVTYAEPKPLEAPSAFNEPWYQPQLWSRRLYYTGKTSLYRGNPYLEAGTRRLPKEFVADDIYMSFYYVYYYGFEAISRAPHAVVYEKVAGTLTDLTAQLSRAHSEIRRVFKRYPEFEILGPVMEQELYPSRYQRLVQRANKQLTYVADWTRLESTK